ncbi:MAG: aminotransferase class IV [Candidatus Nanopelagicales bacterium]
MRFWVRDRLVPPDQATVSVLDHGFTVADGVFETLKVVDGVPFALTRHLERLAVSARGLALPEPDPDLVRKAVADTVAACADEWGPLARLRITYTGGTAPLGSDRGDAEPTLVVAGAATAAWPATTSVVTVPWPRNERSAVAGLKTTSYAENVVALARARERGASEALVPNTRGELCEGTGSNVFVVVDGRVLTPPLTSGCLAGVTRALVLEWIDAEEVDLPMDVLRTADEVFLTSSTRDVHPVHAVDERNLTGPGTAGPVTAEAARQFAARSAQDVDP